MATASNRQMAEQIIARLDSLALSFPQVEQEARRVLNLGIPLAEMIAKGMATATREGREHLLSTCDLLTGMLDICDTFPVFAERRTIRLDSGKEAASWVPLFDAASGQPARGYVLVDDLVRNVAYIDRSEVRSADASTQHGVTR